MDKKTVNIIKKVLRRGSLRNPARNKAKLAAKVDKSTFKCANCDVLCYEGQSSASFERLKEQYGNVIQEKIQLDHIAPVREGKDELDWNDYITSLFCEVDNYQALCSSCHKEKSRHDKNR